MRRLYDKDSFLRSPLRSMTNSSLRGEVWLFPSYKHTGMLVVCELVMSLDGKPAMSKPITGGYRVVDAPIGVLHVHKDLSRLDGFFHQAVSHKTGNRLLGFGQTRDWRPENPANPVPSKRKDHARPERGHKLDDCECRF